MTMTCRKFLILLLVFAIPFSFLAACSKQEQQQDMGVFFYQGTVIYISKLSDGYLIYLEEPSQGPKLTLFWVDANSVLGPGVQSMLDSAETGKKVKIKARTGSMDIISGYKVRPVEFMEITDKFQGE